MAEVTILRCGHVIHRRILAYGVHTVVAAFAVIGHTLVIERAGGKTAYAMAHAAIRSRRNMCGRLAGSIRTIVTSGAIAGDTVVIKDRRFKRASRVAKVAILVRGDMVCGRIFAFSIYTVMTTFTRRGNALVIEHAGGKASGVMAHPAILVCRNVIYRLTHCIRAVMAAGAITGDAYVSED